MSILYAVITFTESLSPDDVLDHVGCIEELSGAHIEGPSTYIELDLKDAKGYFVKVNDEQHDIEEMHVIFYDVKNDPFWMKAQSDLMSDCLMEVFKWIPPYPKSLGHYMMYRTNSSEYTALVYHYKYNRVVLANNWASGSRAHIKPVE